MSKNENLPRQIKTSQSFTNLGGVQQFNQQYLKHTSQSAIDLDLLSQRSYGPISTRSIVTSRNPPLQNLTHKFVQNQETAQSFQYPPTLNSEFKWIPTTSSSINSASMLSPQSRIAHGHQQQISDQQLEDRIIEIVGKCMQQINLKPTNCASPRPSFIDEPIRSASQSSTQQTHKKNQHSKSIDRYAEPPNVRAIGFDQTPYRSRLQLQEPQNDQSELVRSFKPSRQGSMTTLKNMPVQQQSKATQAEDQDSQMKQQQIEYLQDQLRSEEQANDELTEHVQSLQTNNQSLRLQNQQIKEQLNQTLPQCETCIDYIKEVRRLEISLQKAAERDRQNQEAIRKLNEEAEQKEQTIKELEEEVQDVVERSVNYGEREYEMMRQIEKMRAQNDKQTILIRQLTQITQGGLQYV